MQKFSLRPYQLGVIAEHEAIPDGEKVLIVAPTGSGKTVIAAEIIRRAVERGKRVLVLAHRREIINQTAQKLLDAGVHHGVILAGHGAHIHRPVQIASIATLWARGFRTETIQLPPADLLVIDECHHARARTYQKIIEAYPDAGLLGLTATPCRGDGRGLGNVFDHLLECPQVGELVEQGHLVRSRVYAPIDPDLRGVATRTGDYVESQLAERMNTAKLVGDIVEHWHRFGERRRTVAFAVDVRHSVHITGEFVRAGVRAEHLDGSTPTPEREAILARLAAGETELVSNCMVLTEGFDLPAIGCLILARPTKQLGLFRQMVGRALRPADGKPDAVILDHSGAVFRHGLPEDPVAWSLDVDRIATSPVHAARQEKAKRKGGPELVECTNCSAVRTAGEPCPACGFMPKPPPRAVEIAEGDLGLVKAGRAQASAYDPVARAQWQAMLTAIAREKGYKAGWVGHQFRKKFGIWPAERFVAPITPSPEVRAWVRSRQIAYARARA